MQLQQERKQNKAKDSLDKTEAKLWVGWDLVTGGNFTLNGFFSGPPISPPIGIHYA